MPESGPEKEIPENLADLSPSQRLKRSQNIVTAKMKRATDAADQADKRGDLEFGREITDGLIRNIEQDPYETAVFNKGLDNLAAKLHKLISRKKAS
jgi:hypothetical protein